MMELFINFPARLDFSLGSYTLSFGNSWFWTGVFFVVILFLRWWGIKKFLSFTIVISLVLFLMFKLDSVIISRLGDESSPFTSLLKPLTIAIVGFVFLYYAFVRKDSQ
ncbi:MAG: hypothetical protein ABIA97_00965 [Candidatus Omnitrophota bacterium]